MSIRRAVHSAVAVDIGKGKTQEAGLSSRRNPVAVSYLSIIVTQPPKVVKSPLTKSQHWSFAAEAWRNQSVKVVTMGGRAGHISTGVPLSPAQPVTGQDITDKAALKN
jgi:hypothetical protein